jgi:hypothetical protein
VAVWGAYKYSASQAACPFFFFILLVIVIPFFSIVYRPKGQNATSRATNRHFASKEKTTRGSGGGIYSNATDDSILMACAFSHPEIFTT